MLVNLKNMKSTFNKNVYNRFVANKYGINTSYCEDKITRNYLFKELTTLYNDATTISDLDLSSYNIPIVKVTNIINIINNSAHYTHNQKTLSSTWFINHNLGHNPVIVAYDLNGDEIVGTTHIVVEGKSLNLLFNHPQAGIAECSP